MIAWSDLLSRSIYADSVRSRLNRCACSRRVEAFGATMDAPVSETQRRYAQVPYDAQALIDCKLERTSLARIWRLLHGLTQIQGCCDSPLETLHPLPAIAGISSYCWTRVQRGLESRPRAILPMPRRCV